MTDRNSEQVTYSAAQLRAKLRAGEVEEAHLHAGLVPDDGPRSLLTFMANEYDAGRHPDLPARVEETELYRTILATETTDALTDAVEHGNVSQMQYAVGMVDHSRDGADAKTRLARSLTNEGMVTLILGVPGAGKTALTLDVARIWKSLTGGMIVSNVEAWDGTDIVVKSNEEAKKAMQSVRGQVLLVIDEASQSLTGQGSAVKEAETFAKDLKYIRKQSDDDQYAKQGSALIVGHTRKDTAADIRRVASQVAEKPSRRDPGKLILYDSDGGKDSLEKMAEFKGIADTPESYEEHEASSFEVVLESDDQDDGPSVEDVEYRKDVETALKAKLRGDSHEDAARLTDFSSSWVGDRWKEWLRGDHRDLVPMPDDPPELVEKGLERID